MMAGLYGRGRELGLVRTLLARANGPGTGLLIVTGGRGAGKSTFLASASRLAAGSGLEVVQLNAAGLSGVSLRYLLEELREEPLAEFVARWQGWVDFHAPGGSPRGAVVVALDDVDWCRSAESALRIVRRADARSARPLVVVLACPDDVTEQAAAPAAEPATAWDGEPVHRHDDQSLAVLCCRLLPLPREAIERLAAEVLGIPPGPEIMEVCSYAGGVPARLMRVLTGLLEAGVDTAPDGTARPHRWGVLPPQARALASGRLTSVSESTRRMLDIASVLGQSFDLEALSAVLGHSPLSLLPAIREARDAGVLTEEGSLPAFKDLLVWQAVRETVPRPVRGAILRDVGHRLLACGGADELSAGYLLRAAENGDRRAALSLPEAVARRARDDPVAASDVAAQALRLPLLEEDGRVRLVRIKAAGLAVRGLLSEAVHCLDEALKRPLGPGSAGLLHARLGAVHLCAGDLAAAAAQARQVLSRAGRSRAPRETALLLDCCSSRWGNARREPWPAADRRDNRKDADRPRCADPDVAGSHRTWCEGRVAESLDMLHESSASGPAPSWGDRVAATFAGAARVQYLVSLRGFAEAEAELREAEARADASGGRGWHAMTGSLRALLQLEQGKVSAAGTAAEAALDLSRQYGTGALAPLARAVLAVASLRRVDIPAAVRQAEFLDAALTGHRSSWTTPSALWAVLLVTEARQGPRAAVRMAERRLSEGASPYGLLLHAPYTAPWLVRTALAAKLPEFAAEASAAAGFLVRNNPGRQVLGAAAEHARGLLRGDTAALRRAADLHQDPWSRAQAQEDLAGLCEDRNTAVHHLERAVGAYVRSGAPRDAARVRHSLRERGVRKRHWKCADRPVQGWAALTETERTIARLVATGMTNRQAAEQMSLSHHTVNYHLRSIYRKLDITSRVKLAAMVHA
ncbi:LuxR C-terminal-related transcriptional regulator [Streptomyces diacarni]|uniref:helix-turn-helix transcriptional regulator n=1 Tax=Streptomyces diacarni TaxID=2800381 RepID=UPI0033FFBC51